MPTAPSCDSANLTLPRRLDLTAAAPLRNTLLSHRGMAITIDAGEVAHLGTLCLQILLSAAADWRSAQLSLVFCARSGAFTSALTSFAVPLSALHSEG